MAILADRTELTTPADGDLYVTTDVSDTTDAVTGTDKKITWANIKATLKTYFDGLYALTGHNHTGVYEPANANLLETTDIGVSVAAQSHNHTGVYAPVSHAHEGTAILSTGETGGTKFLREDGDGTSSWQTIPASGNVSKVGTPADNQVGVWTGDGTIEGDSNFTWSGTKLSVSSGAKTLDVTGSAYPASIITRTTIGTNLPYTAFSTKAKTSNNMADGFGVDFDMIIEDVDGVENPIGIIRVVRDGADNSGKVSIIPYNAGSQANPFYVLKDGRIQTSSSIELGHASDTTLSRSAAGVLAVEGVVIPSISSTNTLTNKRVTKRVGSTTSSATPTINTDDVDIYKLTAQTVDITSFTTNLSGTPTDGQTLMIQITGTAARAITWGTSFEASTVALPTTTVSTNRLDVGFIWNTATSKWRCIASC